MDAADLCKGECVHVNAVNGESRIVTYVIPGKRGSGCVELNGGAANFFVKGQHVHVNCFAMVDDSNEMWFGESIIVHTDENNKVI
jgi:aspartate 1-decarboxylase